MKLFLTSFFLCVYSCAPKQDEFSAYNGLSTKQLTDTNAFFYNKFSKDKAEHDYQVLLYTANLLIKKSPDDFGLYLNKLNILNLNKDYANGLLFCDTIFDKFKNKPDDALTILLAKGDIQTKVGDNAKAKNTYVLADKLVLAALKTDSNRTTLYTTYVTLGCLAYNSKDSTLARIAKFKKQFPSDTATVNNFLKTDCLINK